MTPFASPLNNSSVLLFDGAPLSGGPLKRASLLAALPRSSYAALRTFGRGSRLLGVEENIHRLVVSATTAAAAAVAAAAAASGSTSQVPSKPQADTTQPACSTHACSILEAEERTCFKSRVWEHLRILLRLFQASAASAAEGAAATAAAAAAESDCCDTTKGGEMLLPEGCEAAVTMALTNVGLPELRHALGLSETPAAAEATAAAAAADTASDTAADTAEAAASSSSMGLAGGMLMSLHLVLLAEPLIRSPFIFHGDPQQHQQQQQQQQQKQQQHQQQQQQQQQEEEQRQHVPSGTPRLLLMTTSGQHDVDSTSSSISSSTSTSNRSSSNSSSSSSSGVRWCNVMLVSHGGREHPEAKSTKWVLERRSLLTEARQLGCIVSLPIEEAVLEKGGCLLEGCSSNLLVYSASRRCVLTAPDTLCLPGLMRSLALRAFVSHGIQIVFEAPRWKDRQEEDWTAAWISSSSRLLLPVRSLLKPIHTNQLQQLQLQQQQQQQLQQQQQQLQQQERQGEGAADSWRADGGGDIVSPSSGFQSDAEAQRQLQQQQQQQQQEQQQQQLSAAAASSSFEEMIFAVDVDSLAARAARWTAELAEAEAQRVF
ncbi:hypothetical protein ACSSS7_003459 [Eimeria intestinalis]